MAKKGGGETVMVVVRMRPFNSKEKAENRGPCITLDLKTAQVTINNPMKGDVGPKSFTFDAVFDMDTQQKAFYEEACYPLIESVMDGFNGTIFAYGQTGCGKTWTMQGLSHPPELRGAIPNSFDHIFQNIKSDPATQFLVRCSYLEIYNEEVRDLLGEDSTAKLSLKEDPGRGVFVKDLREVVVQDVVSINTVMDKGFQNRTVGATLMNEGSSRSHSIFTVVIEANEVLEGGKDRLRAGKLNLVDLAGSERQSKTGATGERMKEGCQINLSLSALGNVISALADGKDKHIPYRDSKLTRLLQDSLGGNTKTLMMAAISPADYNYDETLSTLRYANRAKNIKNKPKINEDPKDTMLREYKDEINRLRSLLEMQTKGISIEAIERSPILPFGLPVLQVVGPSGLAEVLSHSATASPPGMEKRADSTPPGMLLPPGMGARAPSPTTEVTVVEREVERLVERVVHVEKIVERPVEVLPKDHLDKKRALEEYNQSVVDQRNRLGEELLHRDDLIRQSELARDELQTKLEMLKSKVMHGSGISIEGENGTQIELARQERERRQMQAKLRAKKRKEAILEAERAHAEQDKKEAEDELKNAREEAETAERKMARQRKKLEKKLADCRGELEDVSGEFQRERHDLLQNIRDQNRELKLLEQVLAMLLPPREIAKIWERSKYDSEADEWTIPPIKPRKEYQAIALPSLMPSTEDKKSGERKGRKGSARGSPDADDGQMVPGDGTARSEKEHHSRVECSGVTSKPSSSRLRGRDEEPLMHEDWGFAVTELHSGDLTAERHPSRQGARSSKAPDLEMLAPDQKAGRIRPKSGSRSHKQVKADENGRYPIGAPSKHTESDYDGHGHF